MDLDRAPGKRIAWLLATLVAGCALVAGVGAVVIPPPFQTHDQAIGYVLRQHSIAYDQIQLIHAWPDTLSRHAYGADVIIRRADTAQISGRIECKVERTQCYLTVRRLSITHEPVPELTSIPPWLARVQGYLATLGAVARGLVGR
jgi:hypothetical protein